MTRFDEKMAVKTNWPNGSMEQKANALPLFKAAVVVQVHIGSHKFWARKYSHPMMRVVW